MHATVSTSPATVEVVVVKTDGSVVPASWTPREGASLLPQMQTAVGGLIDVAALTRDAAMIVNDEGVHLCDPNPVATLVCLQLGRTQPYFGDVVFIGGVDERGDDKSVPEWLVRLVERTAEALRREPEVAEMIRTDALAAAGR